ncbi:hypothetical protein [Ornithinimicrobium sp. W1665]|uniref:hypothetical protein n=1 Tax=Ornithinimicrobium sp. W1665 TaxID=3416666 RepID=UPI003CEB6FF1
MVDTKQTKTIGEHWACCELARRGWAPALTRDGIERTDILAVKNHGERLMVEVQVKTTVAVPGRVSWHLGSLAHSVAGGEHEWVVLVAADPEPRGPLRSFVVPRSHVSAAAWISHMDWLTHPDAPAGKRTASVEHARVKVEVFAAYEDRWDMVERPTEQAPVLLPTAFRSLATEQRVGLPPAHPWHQDLPSW